MLSLDEVERVARKANELTYTVGVALAPCSLPQTRRPNLEIGDDEMEIGMGIHGEPGVARGPAAEAAASARAAGAELAACLDAAVAAARDPLAWPR